MFNAAPNVLTFFFSSELKNARILNTFNLKYYILNHYYSVIASEITHLSKIKNY